MPQPQSERSKHEVERIELGSNLEDSFQRDGFHNDALRIELQKELSKPEPVSRYYGMTAFQMIGAAAGIGLLAGLLLVPRPSRD